MGRKRKDFQLVKQRVSIRLSKNDIDAIKENGSLQDVIEKLVKEWLNRRNIEENR